MKKFKFLFCLLFAVTLMAYSPTVKAMNPDFHSLFKKEVNETVKPARLNVSFEIKNLEIASTEVIGNAFLRTPETDIMDDRHVVKAPLKPISQLNIIDGRFVKGKAKAHKTLWRYHANPRFYKYNSLE